MLIKVYQWLSMIFKESKHIPQQREKTLCLQYQTAH
nr:MAG TPA: hypothetical protein [Caudoviricetes sp.]